MRKILSFASNINLIKKSNNKSAFTIIELLVVIAIIGILAAIVIVSYNGISKMANESSLKTDISNANGRLSMHYMDYGKYPLTNNCAAAESSTNICIKSNDSTDLGYFASYDRRTYTVSASNSSYNQIVFFYSSSTISCPTGYIVVPGNTLYGTNDFCVMKFEAKNIGGVATSQSSDVPWTNISGTIAISTAASACSGCHLITNAEWLTIAQNILSVPGNWTGDVVGSGAVYNGNSAGITASCLAVSDENNLYSGTGLSAPSNHRRGLTLTNGEVIWDFAGNAREFTSDVIGANQQPGVSGQVAYAWTEWTNGAVLRNGLPESSFPSYSGITGSNAWDATQGMGELNSNPAESTARAYIRGGDWSYNNTSAGIYALSLANTQGYSGSSLGFRVAK